MKRLCLIMSFILLLSFTGCEKSTHDNSSVEEGAPESSAQEQNYISESSEDSDLDNSSEEDFSLEDSSAEESSVQEQSYISESSGDSNLDDSSEEDYSSEDSSAEESSEDDKLYSDYYQIIEDISPEYIENYTESVLTKFLVACSYRKNPYPISSTKLEGVGFRTYGGKLAYDSRFSEGNYINGYLLYISFYAPSFYGEQRIGYHYLISEKQFAEFCAFTGVTREQVEQRQHHMFLPDNKIPSDLVLCGYLGLIKEVFSVEYSRFIDVEVESGAETEHSVDSQLSIEETLAENEKEPETIP